jgi:hypothetical protein
LRAGGDLRRLADPALTLIGDPAPPPVRDVPDLPEIRVKEEGPNVAGTEPVTSPDQHKPGHRRAGQIGAVVSAGALLLMLCGNHRGNVENIWLIGVAVLLLLVVIGDIILRRNGLRS